MRTRFQSLSRIHLRINWRKVFGIAIISLIIEGAILAIAAAVTKPGDGEEQTISFGLSLLYAHIGLVCMGAIILAIIFAIALIEDS